MIKKIEFCEINNNFIDIKYFNDLYVYRFTKSQLGENVFFKMIELSNDLIKLNCYIDNNKIDWDSCDILQSYKYIGIHRKYNNKIKE